MQLEKIIDINSVSLDDKTEKILKTCFDNAYGGIIMQRNKNMPLAEGCEVGINNNGGKISITYYPAYLTLFFVFFYTSKDLAERDLKCLPF